VKLRETGTDPVSAIGRAGKRRGCSGARVRPRRPGERGTVTGSDTGCVPQPNSRVTVPRSPGLRGRCRARRSIPAASDR
jgi:hypothetical protein